ncbi:MAG: ABC transporter ATP-binding protein [Candidatus Limivicinus sp.]|jgi:ATP-binding cassette subfamily B multidrug efflux pump
MLKLKRYLKPYLGLLAVSVCLLFAQAMLDLALPNFMSSIVNVGLQQGGITEAAPEAIEGTVFEFMENFMSGEDRAAVEAAYIPLGEAENRDKILEKFPGAGEGDLVLAADPDEGSSAAFSRASYAAVSFLKEYAPSAADAEAAPYTDMDAAAMADIAGLLRSPGADEKLKAAVLEAAAAPESTTEETGILFTRSFYTQLGADTGAIQSSYIMKVGLCMAGLAVLLTLCAVAANFCLARMGSGVGRDLRRDVFKKVSYFNSDEMDKFSGASLITRSTNDITQLQNFLCFGMRMLCFAPIMGIGGFIMGLSTCINMAWILAMGLIVMLGLILVLFALALPRFKKMQGLIDRLNLVSREELSGLMVIRAFSNQDFMQRRFDKTNKDLNDNTLFVSRSMVSMMPIMMFVMNALCLLIVWFGGKQIAASRMQVGDMMAFIQYAMNVIMSFLFISMMFIMVPRAAVSAQRVSEILDTESSVTDPEGPAELSRPVKGVVEFKDVSFRYEGADENVLEHVSFTARPGETVAFIGSTGSGKSTLVNLIPRFHDVTGGSITLDGVDIRKLRQKELRAVIGYVPQKGMLFRGSVADNLRLGNEKADDGLLRECADIAQASEFIDNLEGGMDAPVSQGGSNVSGGQRQRLAIARALVKKAPIYIFDDSFSALDFKTDAKLRAALRSRTENSTVFIVAQRVSTIMNADRILVLDEGRVVGNGSHSELLKNCRTYREIAESQLSKEELE